jgi:hypothetical protein
MSFDDGRELPDERQRSFLLEGDAFATSVADFERYADGLEFASWLESKALRLGRGKVAKVVTAYADASDDRTYYSDGRLFDVDASEDIASGFADKLWSVMVASIGGGPDALDLNGAMQLVFGRDPISDLFGASLSGRLSDHLTDPSDGDQFPPVPFDDRIPFDKLQEIGCFVALGDAVTKTSITARGTRRVQAYPE